MYLKDTAAFNKTAAAALPPLLTPGSSSQNPNAPPPPIDREILTEILLNAGFKATEENLIMLKLLMENGIPLTNDNIQRMNQALKLTAGSPNAANANTDNHAKALFMIQNDIKLTVANAAQLEGLVSGQVRITDQINNLLQAVRQINDPVLAGQLSRILTQAIPQASQTAPLQATANTAPATNQHAAQPTTQPGMLVTPAQPVSLPETTNITQTQPTQTPTVLTDANQAQLNMMQSNSQQTTVPLPARPDIMPLPVFQAIPVTQQAVTSPATVVNNTTINLTPAPSQPSVLPAPPAVPDLTLPADIQSPTPPQVEARLQANTFEANEARLLPETLSSLAFRLSESTPADIDRFLNGLRDALVQIRQTLTSSAEHRQTPNSEPAATARVLQEVRALSDTIDFTAQIRNQIYVQLPLFHNGQDNMQTTLHIYKDAKKTADGKKGAASALIALDTASLGRFETYIQKDDNSVHCQFRLDNPRIEQLVRDNINQLESLLQNHRFSLAAFSFAKPGKPYTLLDSPTLFDESLVIQNTENTLPRFDKRA